MEGRDLIHARFAARAAAAPGALAISSACGTMSYGALDLASGALAADIGRIGAADGAGVVAILAERGPHVVVAALACARAGRPFVILDLSYPAGRLRDLAGICRPRLLLSASGAAPDSLAVPGLPVLAIPLEMSGETPAATGPEISPDAPAYLLFTSGSTGAPKCVACSHRPLVNFVDWQARTFALGHEDRFTLLSGLSHDPVLRDIFTPLSIGASIHIPTQAELTAPGGLHAWFAQVRPTVAHMTPPLGHLLTAVRGRAGALTGLRQVFFGGDMLRRDLVEALAETAPGCESVNFYGSTETPQAAACFRVPAGFDRDQVPIGAGIDGFELELRGEDGRPAAEGEAGEIVVRSRFLTLGYVTGGRLPAARMGRDEDRYSTGDIGRRGADGQVTVQGRRDDQVKVRGYRVELAEITACALQAPGVAQAITLNLGAPDAVRLGCFVQPAASAGAIETDALRAHIAGRLPAYMVPEVVASVDALPLLANGKIDRQALILHWRQVQAEAQACPAPAAARLSPTEAELVGHWRGILRQEAIGAGSSFASLGGDSLSYVNAYLAVEDVLGAVPDDWTTLTIAELAARRPAIIRRGPFAQIESAMLMRALAIAAVVASHFQLLFTGGGATSALIWVSGFLFGGLQLHEVDHQSNLKPIGRLLRSLLIPLAAIEAPQILVKFLTHYHFRWSSVFLYVDLLDYTGMPASGPEAYGGHEFLMWYIHCIFHILVIYGLLLLGFKYVARLRRPALVSAFVAVGLGLLGRFALPALVVPGFWSGPIAPMSFFNHAPTTHLATFALAALCGVLKGRGRWAVMALTAAFALASAPIFGAIDATAIMLVAAVLTFVPRLSVPRFLSAPIYMVAGASLFIYLLHFKFLAVFNHLPHLPLVVAWLGAVAGGVVVWSGWNWGAQRLAGLWTGLRSRPIAAWRYGASQA